MKRTLAALFGASLVAAFGSALPASADLVTTCVGEGGAVTVPNDLVVPAGQSCTLDGTTIQGNVTVRTGADLVGTGVTIEGNTIVQGDAYLDLTDSSVGGNLANRAGYGVYLDYSSVQRYTGTGDNADTFLSALGTTFVGKVSATSGAFQLEGSQAGRAVEVSNAYYADLIDSVVVGQVSLDGAAYGSLVCGSEIDGDASFTDNAYGVQLGAGGPLGGCDLGSSVWGGNVDVSGTTGDVQVSDNIIRGNLSGEGNDPAPVASDNRVRGELLGQFAEAPAANAPRFGTHSMRTAQAVRAEVDTAREVRVVEAQEAAEAAGPADLG